MSSSMYCFHARWHILLLDSWQHVLIQCIELPRASRLICTISILFGIFSILPISSYFKNSWSLRSPVNRTVDTRPNSVSLRIMSNFRWSNFNIPPNTLIPGSLALNSYLLISTIFYPFGRVTTRRERQRRRGREERYEDIVVS